jgi:NitT/TauT family transport system substrate-binding protein
VSRPGAAARRTGALALAAIASAALLACGGSGDERAVSIALNWKPEPEFGGLFEAERGEIFARHDLDVTVTGGPGAPVVQMVASGQATFGVVAADEVMLARDRGTDLVAVFAVYQTNPQGIMVHAELGADSLAKLFASPEGGTLAVEPGLPYVKWLQSRYDLSRWRLVPYGYSIAPFLHDPRMAQQVFVTSEPIAARRQNLDVRVFLIADSGFDPYAGVVVTTGERVRKHRWQVAAFVAALRQGWRSYLDDPGPANTDMGQLNREMDADTFREAAAAQKPLIETVETKQHGLGTMTLERWTTLGQQLQQLHLIDRPPEVAKCFVNLGP